MTGSYVLLIKLPQAQTIAIGNLADVSFPRGYYAYVGSARSGVKSRLNRHLNRNKKLHWHIDYLLQKATITDIIVGEADIRIECDLARALSAQFDFIPHFGSSDCHCPSHLFFATAVRQLKATVMTAFKSRAIAPKLVRARGHLE